MNNWKVQTVVSSIIHLTLASGYEWLLLLLLYT